MLKNKPIFKVEDCRRKMKSKGGAKSKVKELRDTQSSIKKEAPVSQGEEEEAIKIAEEYMTEQLEGLPQI